MSKALRTIVASALILCTVHPAQANTLRWAYVGDVNSMDPYSLTESFSIAFLNHIYEGLVRYNDRLEVEPALATSWEYVSPSVVRFTLRQDVVFHDGAAFDADDVVVSVNRAAHPDSPIRSNLPTFESITKVDDFTVDLKLSGPTPLLFNFLTNIVVFDKGWLETHDAVAPVDSSKGQESYATTHANGTGPFMLESRRPDAKTTLVVNPGWWDEPRHNLTRIEFTPIASDATRVAALLSGELDFISPSPLQDARRLAAAPGVRVLEGPGLRTIFFGFNMKDALNDSDLESGNPFKDARVRRAFAKALDLPLLRKKIMRGKSRLAGLLVAPEVPGFDPDANEPIAHDPDGARALLAEAGHAEGFTFAMNCPNDRYVNDEEICQAAAAMLSRVGLRAKLTTETKGEHFTKARNNQTDVYMLGWATLPMLDAYSVLTAILHTPGDRFGSWNPGGYSNARVDEITGQIGTMIDEDRRRALMREALRIARDETAAVPLHQQPLSWAARDGVELVQSPDDKIRLWYARKN